MAIKFGDDAPSVRPAPDRLERARAALAQAEGRREALPPGDAILATAGLPAVKAVRAAKEKRSGFDRAAYQKAYMKPYMREYMRGWRARRKAEL